MKNITERKRMEEALRESEAKYRSLFENMFNAFAYHKMLFDENGKPIDYVFLDINGAFEKLTGERRENVIDKKATELFPGIKQAEPDRISIYGKVALTGEPANLEFYSEPVERWYSVSAYSPQKGYFVAVFEDITERKRAEETLRETQNYLLKAQEIAKFGNWLWEKDKDTSFWSEEIYHMLGYTPGEIQPTLEWLVGITHPDDREQVVKGVEESMRTGKSYSGVYRLTRKDGKEIIVDSRAEAILNQAGEATGMIGVIQDITERKRMEETLRESEDKYRAIFENSGTATLIAEEDGTIAMVNTEFEILSRWSREEIEGRKSWTEFTAREDWERLRGYWRLRSDDTDTAPRNYETRFIDRWGNTRNVFVTAALIPGTSRAIASLLDITERKRMEEVLRESEHKYKSYSRARLMV